MSVTQASLLGDTFGSKASGTVPIGGIIMWSGAIASIPTGWSLCDGTGGTPNLRDRFIVGAGSAYNPGETGGSANATLVSHSHTATATSVSLTGQINTGTEVIDSSSGILSANRYNANTPPAGGGGGVGFAGFSVDASHSHTITVDSSGSPGTNANLPPYYALAFIMRVS